MRKKITATATRTRVASRVVAIDAQDQAHAHDRRPPPSRGPWKNVCGNYNWRSRRDFTPPPFLCPLLFDAIRPLINGDQLLLTEQEVC